MRGIHSLDMSVGTRHSTRFSGYVIVVAYHDASNVTVRFEDTGTIVSGLTAGNIRIGKVGDPLKRSVYGIGYNGIGPYNTSHHMKAYNRWTGILLRVYASQNLTVRENYKDCSVISEWHNFQNFAEWFYNQPFHSELNYEVDKDLKILGNKVYGPNTCLLIPKKLNCLIGVSSRYNRIANGVSKRYESSRYLVRLQVSGIRKIIGLFTTLEEASLAYTEAHRIAVLQMGQQMYQENKILHSTLEFIKRNYNDE